MTEMLEEFSDVLKSRIRRAHKTMFVCRS